MYTLLRGQIFEVYNFIARPDICEIQSEMHFKVNLSLLTHFCNLHSIH